MSIYYKLGEDPIHSPAPFRVDDLLPIALSTYLFPSPFPFVVPVRLAPLAPDPRLDLSQDQDLGASKDESRSKVPPASLILLTDDGVGIYRSQCHTPV